MILIEPVRPISLLVPRDELCSEQQPDALPPPPPLSHRQSLPSPVFNETVSCLLRLAWSAAAGRLAQGTAVANREKRSPVEFFLSERPRHSSNGEYVPAER